MRRFDTPAGFRRFLRAHGLLFACAESCTGGLLARQMTAAAGSSTEFWGGVVSYANEAKVRLLGVDASVLEREGAVSSTVAGAMAVGLAERARVPLVASITGVAGPTGGTTGKPVGTVWFGLAAWRDRWDAAAVLMRFGGSRAAIQSQAAAAARTLARVWWESRMDLDSLRSVTDNNGNAVIAAVQPLPPLLLPPL